MGQTAAATGVLAALVRLLQGPGSLQQAALTAMLQLVMCSKQGAHPDHLLQVGAARQKLLSVFLSVTLHSGCTSQVAPGRADFCVAADFSKPP